MKYPDRISHTAGNLEQNTINSPMSSLSTMKYVLVAGHHNIVLHFIMQTMWKGTLVDVASIVRISLDNFWNTFII